jgi:hypothetical protein
MFPYVRYAPPILLHRHAFIPQQTLCLPFPRTIDSRLHIEESVRHDGPYPYSGQNVQTTGFCRRSEVCEERVGEGAAKDKGWDKGWTALVGLQPLLCEEFGGGVSEEGWDDDVTVGERYAWLSQLGTVNGEEGWYRRRLLVLGSQLSLLSIALAGDI